MVSRTNFVAFFHLVVIFHHSIAVHYDFMHIAPKELQLRKFSFGGRFIYLYVWNMVLQLIYFIMAFINDFIESKDTNTNQRTRFTRIKDFIFSALVFPVACDVGVMFWIFYFINPVLIASSEQHELVPAWFCHMLRTHIVIFVVFEIILIHRIYPCHLDALLALLTFILTYLAWTLIVYLETDEWIYPVMEKFNWPQRIGFFGLNVFAPVTFYVVGDLLNNLAWTSKLKQRRISNVPRESTSCIDSNDRTLTITNITEV